MTKVAQKINSKNTFLCVKISNIHAIFKIKINHSMNIYDNEISFSCNEILLKKVIANNVEYR